MDESFSVRRIGYALAALVIVLAIGTVGFRWALDETWLQSFYRAVVTSSLTGLDSVPKNDAARVLSIFMAFAGVTIFAYVASMLVERIARGVLTGALAENRRRRTIEKMRDHDIICGYVRTGAVIVAIRKRDGHFETTPNPDMTVEPGDVIIGAGTEEELRALDELFRPAEAVVAR